MGAAALRYELGRDHTYEFVEGVVEHERAPGIYIIPPPSRYTSINSILGIESLAPFEDQFFAYYDFSSSESFDRALYDLREYLHNEGPFDGLIAFSQGASLASAILIDQSESPNKLRCAIFFCGRTPFVDVAKPRIPDSTEVGIMDKKPIISIPTVHIWGRDDHIEPGQPEALSKLCCSQDKYTYIHAGGHEVPGAKDKEGLIESANAIKKMIARLL